MRQGCGIIREAVHALDKITSSTLVLILKSKHKTGMPGFILEIG